MRTATFVVESVPFGEPARGLWCDRCLLPSVVSQPLRLVTGMSVLAASIVEVCVECGRWTCCRDDGTWTQGVAS